MFESTFFTFHSEPKSIIMKFVHSNLNPNHIIPYSLLKNDRNMILRIPLIETHIPNRTSSISHESENCFSYLRQSQIEYRRYLTNPNTALFKDSTLELNLTEDLIFKQFVYLCSIYDIILLSVFCSGFQFTYTF